MRMPYLRGTKDAHEFPPRLSRLTIAGRLCFAVGYFILILGRYGELSGLADMLIFLSLPLMYAGRKHDKPPVR